MSAAASGLPDIVVVPDPRGFAARVADFDARKQVAVDGEIERLARTLCKDSEINWGTFNSDTALGKKPGSEPVIVHGYTRKFACIVPQQQIAYEPAPADWKPTRADQDDALGLFARYYDTRDAGDFAAAAALLQPDLVSDLGEWSARNAEQNKKFGSGKRRVTGVIWYVNPAGAPHPGVYVALDFAGDFPNTLFDCGYVVLFRRGSGSYVITREEENSFARGDGTADPAQVAQMRAAMCRGQ